MTDQISSLTGLLILPGGYCGTVFVYAGWEDKSPVDREYPGLLFIQCAPHVFDQESTVRQSKFIFSFGTFTENDVDHALLSGTHAVSGRKGWTVVVVRIKQSVWDNFEEEYPFLKVDTLPVRAYDESYYRASDLRKGNKVSIQHFSNVGKMIKDVKFEGQHLHKSAGKILYVSESLFLTSCIVERGAAGAAVIVNGVWVGTVVGVVRDKKTGNVVSTIVRRVNLEDLIQHYEMEVCEEERRAFQGTRSKSPKAWQTELLTALDEVQQLPALSYVTNLTVDDRLIYKSPVSKAQSRLKLLRRAKNGSWTLELLDYVKYRKGLPVMFRASVAQFQHLRQIEKSLKEGETLFLRYLAKYNDQSLGCVHVQVQISREMAPKPMFALVFKNLRQLASTSTGENHTPTGDLFLAKEFDGDVSFFSSLDAYRESIDFF